MRQFHTLALEGVLLTTSCANFRKLGQDLKILDDQYRVSGIIENADTWNAPVRAVIVEWDRRKEANNDAVEIRGFDEDHVSILSSREALTAGQRILDQATP